MGLAKAVATKMSDVNEFNILITSTRNKIHYPSEWDPRGHAKTKGGYLEREITIPKYNEAMIMTIQTYPVQGNGMEEALSAEIHPTLLHRVKIGQGKRDQEKEPVPMEAH